MKLKIFTFLTIFPFICLAQVNNNFNNFYMLGQNYEQAGELEKAKGIYEDLYKKQPNNYAIFDALNRIYILLKNYNSSIQLINDQLKFSPGNINLYGLLGTSYFLMGNENKAYQTWDNALSSIPENENNYRTMANYAIQLRAFQKAAGYLKKGEEISKNPNYFSFDLANIYQLMMQYKDAAKEYCSILSNDPQQLGTVQARIMNYINKPEALNSTIEVFKEYSNSKNNFTFNYILARLYIENKSYVDAYKIYKDIDKDNKSQGMELFNFAQLLFNENQFSTASEVFKDIIEEYPKSPVTSMAKLGYAKTLEADLKGSDTSESWKQFHFINSGKTPDEEKVVSAYMEVAEIYPHTEVSYEAYLHAGRIKLYNQNDLTGAEKYFEQVITDSPNSSFAAAAYAELGKIYLLQGDLNSAELNFSKIIENQNLGKASRNYAALQLAKIYFYKCNFEKARKLLDPVFDDLKDNSANDAIEFSFLLDTSLKDSVNLTIFSSAEFLAEQQKFKEAADIYKTVANKPQAFLLRSISMLREAQMEIALNNYEKSIVLLGEIAEEGEKNIYADKALYLTAKIYQFGLNETSKAVEAYEKLLAKFPNSLYLDAARDEIIKLKNKIS